MEQWIGPSILNDGMFLLNPLDLTNLFFLSFLSDWQSNPDSNYTNALAELEKQNELVLQRIRDHKPLNSETLGIKTGGGDTDDAESPGSEVEDSEDSELREGVLHDDT
jgi:hypothetical protein